MDDLKTAIEQSWSAQTSFCHDEWSTDNPARGQCAVTALVIQDHLGGELIKCEIVGSEETHFYNQLPDGGEVDLTHSQFPDGTIFNGHKVGDREKMLSQFDTQERYDTLKQLVAKQYKS